GDGVGALTVTGPSQPVVSAINADLDQEYGSPQHYSACVARIRDIRKKLGQKWEEVASLTGMSKSKLLKNLTRRPAEWTDFLDSMRTEFQNMNMRVISRKENE